METSDALMISALNFATGKAGSVTSADWDITRGQGGLIVGLGVGVGTGVDATI
ncbi:MAG: hypothetical protein BWY05_01577 [Euryarchaeota archaeon ADurb.Bin165]|nr:MAG: hypothetical protein BWY05_01577 [Euryarchaeota archaeon ADurb.Bin165]